MSESYQNPPAPSGEMIPAPGGKIQSKDDTFHTPLAVERVAFWAKNLGWVFAIAAILLLVASAVGTYYQLKDITQQIPWYGLLSSIMNILVIPMICGFFAVFLIAISEALFVLLDIEDSTRRSSGSLPPNR